jgi:hypothetical protein
MSRDEYFHNRYVLQAGKAGDTYLERHEQRREAEATYQHGASPEQPSSDGEGVLGFVPAENDFAGSKPSWNMSRFLRPMKVYRPWKAC